MKILKSKVCLGKLDNKNGQKMIEGGGGNNRASIWL